MTASHISKQAAAMSLRTGIKICNHGMVPVYHPTGGAPRFDSIHTEARIMRAARQPQMDDTLMKLMIADKALDSMDNLFDTIGDFIKNLFGPKTTPQPEPEPQPKPEPAPQPKPEPAPQPKPEPAPEPAPEPEPVPEAEGDPDKYTKDIKQKQTTKIDVIKYGGPFHYIKFYKVDGKPIAFGSQEYKDLVKALNNGSMQEADGRSSRVLDNEITLSNGKKAVLSSESEIAEIRKTLVTKGGGADTVYKKYTETDGTWTIFKNGQKLESFKSQAAFDTYVQQNNITFEDE